MSDRFRELETPPMVRTKDVVLMATVSSYESMSQPGRHELRQFAELFEPVFKASSIEARRNAVAALSRCAVLPRPVAWFLGNQPIELAALFLTRSTAVDDDTLITIARRQGAEHRRAIAARDNLSVKVVDALVSLHHGNELARGAVFAEPMRVEPAPAAEARDERLRQQLRTLVQRDTIAREQDSDAALEAQEQALLVRFARLRQARDFSRLLANMLGSSLWLTNRIMLDVSGLQLATVLIAIDTTQTDGLFILGQFYPHLQAPAGETSRAEVLWKSLDVEECRDRLAIWIRADDYTQGKPREDEGAANANQQAVAPALPGQRPAFGRARASMRR